MAQERYQKLFSLPAMRYAAGAPVLIAAGALLKDTQTGKVLAQLKFKTVSARTIRAVKVRIDAFDISGKQIEGVAEQQYLDLNAARGQEFGQKQPVMLPDAVTRSFRATCTEIVFADGDVWTGNSDWQDLPQGCKLEDVFGRELAAQYVRGHNKAVAEPVECADLWRCACGEWNRADEEKCNACRAEKAEVFARTDRAALQTELDAYKKQLAEKQAAEAEKKAEEKEKAAAAAKKRNKLLVILAAVAVVIIAAVMVVTKVVMPANDYQKAAALMTAGSYEEAAQAFAALGDYKDAAAQKAVCDTAIAEAKTEADYQAALAMFESGNAEGAADAFAALGSYKDSADRLAAVETELAYRAAVQLHEDEKYGEAYEAFLALGDYADAAQYAAGYQYLLVEIYEESVTGGNIPRVYAAERQQFLYDAVGNVAKQTITTSNENKADVVNQYAYSYYEDGTLKEVEYLDGSGWQDGIPTQGSYNEHGDFLGNSYNTYTWTYTGNGKEAHADVVDANGRLRYEIDRAADGAWTRSQLIYDSDLNLQPDDYYIEQYDANGNLVLEKQDHMYVDGVREEVSVYNEYGDRTELMSYKDGEVKNNLSFTYTWTYDIDENGNVVYKKCVSSSLDGSYGVTTEYSYTYDENGTLLYEEIYQFDELVRTVTYTYGWTYLSE